MKVIMKVQLANNLGVFNPGDEYEADIGQCSALIEHGYAFDPSEPGPETAMKDPPREKAVKPAYQNKEWLFEHKKRRVTEVAKECGVSEVTIYKWLKKFGIDK